MDDIVSAAMLKWPNVPAVTGWLHLDARGQWWIRQEKLHHQGMVDFFYRNYGHDDLGRYYVQNGPQRVYVSLEAAPWVARIHGNVRSVLPCDPGGDVCKAYIDESGVIYLDLTGSLAVVDDRDVACHVDQLFPDWDGNLLALPAILNWLGTGVPLEKVDSMVLLERHGVMRNPQLA